MKLRGGSFGLIVLLVTMGVVLLLVAQAWKRWAPAALEVSAPDRSAPAGSRGTGSEDSPDASTLPNLDDARNATDAHASAVDEALAVVD